MVGRKLIYLYGFLIFILGSALCGVAPTLLSLDGFRLVQGAGAAMLQANSVAILVLALPREQLGRGIGIQGAAQALGLALGPTIGGALIAAGGWRLIFFVNVPAGIAGAVLAWFLIPRSTFLQERVSFDWAGLAFFIPAIASVLCAVSFGDTWGWTSPSTLLLIAGFSVLAVFFIMRERSSPHPLLDLSLFRRIEFTAGISSGLFSYMVMFGTLFIVPFYLERAMHQSPARSGLLLAIMPVAFGVIAPWAGKTAGRFGARSLTVAGMTVAALSAGGMALWHSTQPAIAFELIALGVGLGLFTSPNNAAIMGSVPKDQSGVASGALNMTRGMGTAMGLAFTGSVFGVFAGSARASEAAVGSGFRVSMGFLCAIAAVALLLAAKRSNGSLQPGRRCAIDLDSSAER
jgi:EmrB/QacA subfamily drug resistance transporter